MRHKKILWKNKSLLAITAIFLFYFFISILTPMTSDDWVWGSHIGIDRLNNFFYNYNGRYLGNILEIIFTRSLLLKGLFMASINTMMVAVIALIVWNKLNAKRLFIVLFLILLLPLTIFSQTYGWAAGFANYNTSILFTLIGILIFKDLINNQPEKDYSVLYLLLILIIGFASQLFAEHVTIYNVMFSIFVFILSIVQKKKIYRSLSYLVGIIGGTVLMFSNQAYLSILQGKDTYRTIDNTSFFDKIVTIFVDYMSNQLIVNNYLINLCISILLIVIIKKSDQLRYLKNTFISYLVFYPIFCLFAGPILQINFVSNSDIDKYLMAIFSFVYILIIGLSFLFFINKEKMQLVVYICSFAAISAPLFFVTPLSPRCFLASYMFLVIVAAYLLKIEANEKIYSLLNPILTYGVVILAGTFFVVFLVINRNYNYRTDYIQEKIEQGDKEVKFWRIPNEQFIYESTPNPNGYMEKNFRRFYDIPDDVKLQRVSID